MLITGRANTDVSRYHSIADIMAGTKCKCRAALQEGWNFCAQCGTRIKQDVKASLVLGAGEAIGQGVKSGDRILKL